MFANATINEVSKNIQSNLGVKKLPGTPKKTLKFPGISKNPRDVPITDFWDPPPSKSKSLLKFYGKPFWRLPVVLCWGALAGQGDFCLQSLFWDRPESPGFPENLRILKNSPVETNYTFVF